MKAAFYIGTRPGYQGIYNRIVRAWESGESSHVELIFSDGLSGSASMIDGGVRLKQIDYDPTRWVIIDLGDRFNEEYARQWFELKAAQKAKYDLLGQLHFVFSPIRGNPDAYWCSEAVAAALQLQDPWRYGPNMLMAVLTSIVSTPAPAGFFLPRDKAINE